MPDQFSQVDYSGDRLPATLELADGIARRWGTGLLAVKIAREIKRFHSAKTPKEETEAIRDWIYQRVPYIRDPRHAELIGDPLWVLQQGGDCDDQAALAGALLQALGHETATGAVRWEGKQVPSHAVCIDLTAGLICDPVAGVPCEDWPPQGRTVAEIKYRTPGGEIVPLEGLFGKLIDFAAKPFTSIFKPHTLLGKIADPLGLMSRNLSHTKRVGDVAGTAAALACGGWLAGTYGAGVAPGAGFWSTVGQGYSWLGSKALAGLKSLGSGAKAAAGSDLGKTALTLAALQPSRAPALPMMDQGVGFPIGYGFSGGGSAPPMVFPSGGGGMVLPDAGLPGAEAILAPADGASDWILPAMAAGALLLVLTMPKRKRSGDGVRV